ncbi:Zn-ribbon domain-containing OB-fold protein [Rhodococcoides yunnanense]|uniref:Zn-ribbon domain-containing OB-fold protein n=1 Tax=Rhodococcoides yunnanense TaxID=278209 RepID=UPI0009323D0F|nr:OB-fold domain-containing protein [Rhodococcus yunnanensis]
MRTIDGVPVPVPTPVSRPYWDALRQHRIEIQYSPSTDAWVFYPRILAPGSLADDLEWREIEGSGVLSTYTISTRPTAPPWKDVVPQYLAIVQWDQGPRICTELVDVEDPTALTVGMAVLPVFVDVGDDVTLLKYRPAV